ncbi:MAG: polysaccharide biosynthesis/export family protein, partial [Bacteroidaceae bacterium]|nr:polysaccharide biosynthesis/export family protein [Bacteroidaceae bacterium]
PLNNSYSQQNGISYFQVDESGVIDFPVFGSLKVMGMTTREISDMLRQKLVTEGKISDAVVTTKVMNFKVTVLGDVKNPGTFTCTGERMTLMEALGKSGDLNNSAYRQPVLVYREDNGKRVAYEVDLCDQKSVFESPAYYLQQNDVVYVKPNKSQRLKGSLGYTWLSIGSTVLGMLISIASLVISLSR